MTVDGVHLCARDGERESLKTCGDRLAVKSWSDVSKSKAASFCGFGEGH